MRIRTSRAVFVRAALAGLAAATLAACGAKEPATDAERLARGRDLVKQMSSKLASATVVSVETTEQRDLVRGARKETVSLTGSYTLRRPDRFHTKMTGGRGLESWYNGKTLTVASHQQKVFAQAPMPETIDRTLDALAERYDMALPMGDLFYSSPEKAAAFRHHHRRLRRHRECRRYGLHAPGLQGRRRRVGAVAPGAGRSAAEAVQGDADQAHGSACRRRDVHRLGRRAADERCDVHPEACRRTTKASPCCSGPRRSSTRAAASPPDAPAGNEVTSRKGVFESCGHTPRQHESPAPSSR